MRLRLILTITILLCSIASSFPNHSQPVDPIEIIDASAVDSPPIMITSDADLLIFPGNGTYDNPYRIEGYSISDSGSLPCISISNTTLWVLIQNCTLTNSTSAAIDLKSLANVIVRNVSCQNTVNGIRLNNVVNVSVESSTFKNCDLGVSIINSDNCQILNNTVLQGSTGVHLSGTSEIRVSHNLIQDMVSQGIYIDNNLNLIDNNTLVNNTVGIEFKNGNSNMIYQNELFNCSYGVFSIDSMYCDISNNTFMDIKYGVYLYQGNAGYSISWNAFYPSGELTVFDDMPENHFFYNFYWDYDGSDHDNDGIGDTPYAIAGSGNNQDVSPLMNPPGSVVNDTKPPNVYWDQPFEKLEYGEEMLVNPTIIDVNGVKSAVLSFNNGADQWFNISMTSKGIKWQATIPAYSSDVVIVYRIYSCDGKDNWGVAGDWSYSVARDAYSPQVIDSVFLGEAFATVMSSSEIFESHTFKADVIDESEIAYVVVYYQFKEYLTTFDNGTVELSYDIISSTWTVTINFPHAVDRYTAIFQYEAADVYGNIGSSPPYELTFIASSQTLTRPHSSPAYGFTLVSLGITAAVIVVILIMEFRGRTRSP